MIGAGDGTEGVSVTEGIAAVVAGSLVSEAGGLGSMVAEGIAAVVAGSIVSEAEGSGSMLGAGGVTERPAVGAMSVGGTGGCGGVNFSAA